MLNPLQKAAIEHLVVSHFSPPETRLSDAKWCEAMNVTQRTLGRWKKDAEFRDELDRRIRDLEACDDPFALVARSFALEQMYLSAQKEKGAEKRHYLNLLMANTAHVAPKVERVRYEDLTDEQLLDIALARDIREESWRSSLSSPEPLASDVVCGSDGESDTPPSTESPPLP